MSKALKIGYARVSTQDQNLDLQINALKKEGCDRIFEEKASGGQRDRPELERALDMIREDDTLVVWKLDRLARSTRIVIDTIEKLKAKNAHFHSITEKIDTSTAMGKFFYTVMGALGELEKSLIIERTQAGLAAAKAKGKLLGRPVEVSIDKLQDARALLKDPDRTVKQAAKTLRIAPSTLYRHMKSYGGREGFVQEKPIEAPDKKNIKP